MNRLERELAVSILNGPFGPLQRYSTRFQLHAPGVSILNGPFGPLQLEHELREAAIATFKVSILNGPFGPLQPGSGASFGHRQGVSILNGPFGPLQPFWLRFLPLLVWGFNPQRAFRPVATSQSRRTGGTRTGFNPQRAFRPVATRPRLRGKGAI